MFRTIVVLFVLGAYFTNQGLALSVAANNTTLGCGTTSVTFTFDCTFTGSVFITGNTTGVTFPGLGSPPYIETVTNGSITFDIDIAPGAPTNFNVSFNVLNSDLPCGTGNASESFTTTCVLPPNYSCATAIPLPISTNTCTFQSFTTTNSTIASSVPSCGIAGYHDLWYSFTANNTTVTLETGSLPGTVGHYGLYTACGGNSIDCSIIIPGTGVTSFDLTGLAVGADYYLQMLFLPDNSGQDQSLCLHSTTVAPPTCPNTITVSDAGANPPNQSYDAADIITTSGACNVTGTNITFSAGQEISLNAGFDSGMSFEAVIGVCVP